MIGKVLEHSLPILWGSGSNGKTITTETVLDIFGDYGLKANADLLLNKQGDAHPTERADLHGKRLVIASETDDGRHLSEATVKELSGGDTVRARRMRENFWSFTPSHQLLLTTNHRPQVRGTDHGVWRRLSLLPFTVKFWDADKGETGPPELQADKRLKDKLVAERPGILYWLVQGCLDYQRNSLPQPTVVSTATAKYRAAEDVMQRFCDECCLFDPTAITRAADLRKRLDIWAVRSGEPLLSPRKVGEWLDEKGITRRKSSTVIYEGIGILTWE